MAPHAPILDLVDSILADAIVFSYSPLGPRVFSYGEYRFYCQFVFWMILAVHYICTKPAFFNAVFHVVSMRTKE